MQGFETNNPHARLELLHIFQSPNLDIWTLLLALKNYWYDSLIQKLVCHKLYTFDSQQVDFFLPQLCQIVIDRGKVVYVQRLLIDLCRRSIRTGLLASFFFKAAVVDNIPGTIQLCQRMETNLEQAVLSSNKNKDLIGQIELYKKHLLAAPIKPNRLLRPGATLRQPQTLPVPTGEGHIHIREPSPSPENRPRTLTGPLDLTQVNNALLSMTQKDDQPLISFRGHDKGKLMDTERERRRKAQEERELREAQYRKEQEEKERREIEYQKLELQKIEAQRLQKLQEAQEEQTRSVVQQRIRRASYNSQSQGLAQSALRPKPVYTSALVGTGLEKIEMLANLVSQVTAKQRQGKHDKKAIELIDQVYDSTKVVGPIPSSVRQQYAAHSFDSFDGRDPGSTRARSLSAGPTGYSPKTKRTIARQLSVVVTETPKAAPLQIQVDERKIRSDYFQSQFKFIKKLTDISNGIKLMGLKDKLAKNAALQKALIDLNQNIDQICGVYIPILSPDGTPYRVVRVPPKEALCLNSRDRVPYLINIEVVSGLVEANQPVHQPNEGTLRNRERKRATSQGGNEDLSSDQDGHYFEQHPLIPPKTKWLTDKFEIMEDYEGDWVILDCKKKNDIDGIFGNDWEARKKRIRSASPLGHLHGWNLLSVIVKAGDDLRQEQLAMQLIHLFDDIFKLEGVNGSLQLCPYMVLATSGDAGLIETVHDAISIHGLKASDGFESLYRYFIKAYGPPSSPAFQAAQTHFIQSVAAYSLVTYLLQIKDRHNGNILIDRDGRIIHIDYGFMLSSNPGNLNFESSPFKLNQEMLEVMGGQESNTFKYFNHIFQIGFMALRRNYRNILCTIELMINAGGGMACFQAGEATISNLKDRFKLELNETECKQYCRNLVTESCGNWRTGAYDNFQYWSNGIL